MKTSFLYFALTIATAIALNSSTSCSKKDNGSLDTNPAKSKINTPGQNSLIHGANGNVHGKSYGEWAAEYWKWALSFNCSTYPVADATGAFQGQGQTFNNVHFLAGTTGGTHFVRNVTVPSGKSIFVPLISDIVIFPCAGAPAFLPPPGQSLPVFLTVTAIQSINSTNALSAQLDGLNLLNLTNYRAYSPMFTFTGNATLSNVCSYVDCLSGTQQQATSDGFWLMIKPMGVGSHTLHLFASDSQTGFTTEVTYNITVQ